VEKQADDGDRDRDHGCRKRQPRGHIRRSRLVGRVPRRLGCGPSGVLGGTRNVDLLRLGGFALKPPRFPLRITTEGEEMSFAEGKG